MRCQRCSACAFRCRWLTASAWAANHGPRYILGVVEGETTLPEYDQVATTYGKVEPSRRSPFRSFATARPSTETSGAKDGHGYRRSHKSAKPSRSNPRSGTLIGSYRLRRPALDRSHRVRRLDELLGRELARETRSKAPTATYVLKSKPYGQHEVRSEGYGEAQVKTLSGTTFGGSFLAPLVLGRDGRSERVDQNHLAGERDLHLRKRTPATRRSLSGAASAPAVSASGPSRLAGLDPQALSPHDRQAAARLA